MSLRPIATVLVLTLTSGPAAALTGDVLNTLTTPGPAPTGLAFDGESLWVADRLDDQLYAIDPATGDVIHSLPAPGFVPLGLAWDGTALWCLDGEENLIHRLDPATGRTTTRFEAPTRAPRGLAWDGVNLWLSDARDDVISRISTDDGTTVLSLPSPSGNPEGLAFDGTYLWVADRIDDRIDMVEVEHGQVVVSIEAPGPYVRGLAWAGDTLWAVDYQDDQIYALLVDRTDRTPRLADATRERVVLTHEFRNYGPGQVPTLDVYLALPHDLPNQSILREAAFDQPPTDVVTDRWGQKLAHWRVENVPLAERVRHTMTIDVELRSVRWTLFPEAVGSLEDIPTEVAELYLVDEDKYRIHDPVIQAAVAEAVGDETHPYWIMRRIHRWVGEHLEYELIGGWNVAPAVIDRGTGSCSEYTFVFIAMCRAAGLPARYAGAVMVRGDAASTDEVFHRWPEVYLPGYGWVPADAQAGDKPSPAAAADSIGRLRPRSLITTLGGGASELLGWSYNHNEAWVAAGPVKTHVEAVGEWSPLPTDGE